MSSATPGEAEEGEDGALCEPLVRQRRVPCVSPRQVSSAAPGDAAALGRRGWAACPQQGLEMALVPSVRE